MSDATRKQGNQEQGQGSPARQAGAGPSPGQDYNNANSRGGNREQNPEPANPLHTNKDSGQQST